MTSAGATDELHRGRRAEAVNLLTTGKYRLSADVSLNNVMSRLRSAGRLLNKVYSTEFTSMHVEEEVSHDFSLSTGYFILSFSSISLMFVVLVLLLDSDASSHVSGCGWTHHHRLLGSAVSIAGRPT